MFVLIDTKTNTYTRVSGRTRLQEVKSDEPLSAYWVETLRVRPQDVLPQEEPELA